MHYIFILNGREDKQSISLDVRRQLEGTDIDHEFYTTTGEGDATRFVNIYSDLNPKKEVCFVSCCGQGTVNEIISGVVNRPNKYLAILALGGSNDLTKCYPERDFTDISKLLEGECHKVDAIRINDNYAINVISVGLDAKAAFYTNVYASEGKRNPYQKGTMTAIFSGRDTKMRMSVDGQDIGLKRILLATFSNGQYYGTEFHCAPFAKLDDGLIDVCVMKACSLLRIGLVFGKYKEGRHLEDNWLMRHTFMYRQAKHIEMDSNELLYLNLDGELLLSRHVVIDMLEKSVNLIIPKI